MNQGTYENIVTNKDMYEITSRGNLQLIPLRNDNNLHSFKGRVRASGTFDEVKDAACLEDLIINASQTHLVRRNLLFFSLCCNILIF